VLSWECLDSVQQEAVVKMETISARETTVIIKRGASDEAEHRGVS